MNTQIYNSNDPYPVKIIENSGVDDCRGYSILTVNLYPTKYFPNMGILHYYPHITINIDVSPTGKISPFFRNNKNDEDWVKNLVVNPETVKEYQSLTLSTFDYPGGICDPSDNYDYVIITTTQNGLDDWATSTSLPYNWTSLMDKHQIQDGLSCKLVTIQEINAVSDYYDTSNSLFNDTAAHIREFCKDAYQDWGTEYVLIGGDQDKIPRRLMDYDYESNCETDIYWSNLNKTFNADNDNDWGEEGDSGFDLYSELFIGSLPCDEPQDVSNWMTKSFYYADSVDQDYLDNAAFYGGNTGWTCQGDDFIDYSAIKGTDDYLGPDPHNNGPYPTWLGFQYGFETWNNHATNLAQQFNLTNKWTAEPPNPGWQGGSESAAINGLKTAINNDEVTLISGIAHADSSMSLDVYASSWEADYHNTKPFFIHDYGCHCGDMSASDDGVLHSMLFHSDTELAFGCVYNTGYGWGNSGGTNSSSSVQQKSFWDYFFDLTNNSITPMNWQLGKAQAWSKDLMAPTINWTSTGAPGSWRGIIESCLLFADPAQRLKPPVFAEHGVTVTNLDVDSVVPHGETITVEATIANEGINNETNILVNFTIDDVVIDDTTITTLGVGQVEQVSFDWNPDYGTYEVAIVATPVPGENFTNNNELNKTVSVIAAPDIYVSPGSFEFHVNAGDSDDDTLIIGNEVWAEASLHFNASISGGSWLSVSPDTGTVAVDDSMSLTVTADAATLTEGVYQEYIIIDCDDLDESVVTISVELYVVFADDVGAVCVNSPIGQQLPSSYTVNATITNFGSSGNTFMVNCSIFEGVNLLEDFEDNNGGYTGTGDWEWGNPTAGPGNAHSGSNVWATNLNGAYSNYANEWVDSAPISIPTGVPAELGFWHWYNIEDGYSHYDGGNVKISTDGGSTWTLLGSYLDPYPIQQCYSGNSGIPGEPCFTGSSGSWNYVTFDLSSYAGEQVMFRWHFGSDTSLNYEGWYIDDVSVNVQGSSQMLDDTPVYTSSTSVYIDAYDSVYVEFSPSWDANQLGVYAINVTTMLVGDEDPSNDKTMGVVEIATAPSGHIALLSEGWNFVALPFNQTINKDNLVVNYGGFDHNWIDAVDDGFVSDYLFGWDRVLQSYQFVDTLMPGYGYWVYAYDDCELKAPIFEVNFEGYITEVEENWNVIGLPNNAPINKVDVMINNEGSDYSWSDAVTNGYISDYIFCWDSSIQSYTFSDMLDPGYGYWFYAYQCCKIKENN